MKVNILAPVGPVRLIAVCAAAWLTASLSPAVAITPAQGEESVRVIVNGEPVRFDGIGPTEIGGRLMVPLRGVLEKTGANLDWLPATQTAVAARGGLMLELTIGSRNARVNGRTVRMDVPAMTIAGRTMVPLRFVTESLGGQVDWDRQTRTVSIESADRPNRGRDDRDTEEIRGEIPTPKPRITSLTYNLRDNLIGAGETFHIVVHGTPGGQAWFRIRGTVGELKMHETESGVYEGSWRNDQTNDIRIDPHDILAFVVVKNTSTPETMPDGIRRP